MDADDHIADMLKIGRDDVRRVLERVVGGISEKFWKENHINTESADDEIEDAETVKRFDNADFDSGTGQKDIEMDM